MSTISSYWNWIGWVTSFRKSGETWRFKKKIECITAYSHAWHIPNILPADLPMHNLVVTFWPIPNHFLTCTNMPLTQLCANRQCWRIWWILLPLPRIALRRVRTHQEGTGASQPRSPLLRVQWEPSHCRINRTYPTSRPSIFPKQHTR